MDWIREKFETFCGPTKFARFLESFNKTARKRGRLAFFQEELWFEFTKQCPEFGSLEFEQLVPIFRVCHVHKVPLFDQEVPIVRGLHDVYYSQHHDKAESELFPYAAEFVLDSPAFESMQAISVDRCNECLKAKHTFEASEG
jgi:hypothetical protein